MARAGLGSVRSFEEESALGLANAANWLDRGPLQASAGLTARLASGAQQSGWALAPSLVLGLPLESTLGELGLGAGVFALPGKRRWRWTKLGSYSFDDTELGAGLSWTSRNRLLPGELRLGLGYRLVYQSLSFEGSQSSGSDAAKEQWSAAGAVKLSGWNPAQLQLGLVYLPWPELGLSMSWSPSSHTELTARDWQTEVHQETELRAGLRGELDRYGLNLEFSYRGGSSSSQLRGSQDNSLLLSSADRSSWGMAVGTEYRLPWGLAELPLALGFSYGTGLGSAVSQSGLLPLTERSLGWSWGLAYRTPSSSLGIATSWSRSSWSGGAVELLQLGVEFSHRFE